MRIRQMGQDRRLVELAALGVLTRLVVIVLSDGSNDVFFWGEIAQYVRELGLSGAYEATAKANHPPLMALYMSQALTASELTGIPFPWLVKLPALAGDLLAVGAIWAAVASRRGADAARQAAAAYLLNPAPILLVGYHGNTDMLYAGLSLAAVVALDRHRPAVAGLLVGASVNVKLVPLVLGAAFLSILWRREGLGRFAAGAAVAAIPLAAAAAQQPMVFAQRVLLYQYGNVEPWGITGIEQAITGTDAPWYHAHGRLVLAAALVVAAVVAHRRHADPYETVALAAMTFLVFTPAFGLQYLALALPVMFAADLPLAGLFAWSSGVVLAMAYASAATWTLPVRTVFLEPLGPVIGLVALVPWAVCLWALRRLGHRDGGCPNFG